MVMAGEEDAAVVEYARYLGIEPHEDASLMYIAREAVVAQLPPDWEEHTDDDGNTFYFNEKEDRSMWEHPCDAHYRGLVLQVRQAVQPSKQEAAGAQDVPLEVSASSSTSGLEARLPVKPALLQEPSTDVKNTVNAGDKMYLDAISSPEARCWWAENIGRKRVRTRHVTKLLAAWLMGHDTSNAKTLNTATSNIADDVVTNSSTTREYARIVVNAMATEEGKVSVDDFGSFVANSLQGDFSPTALRSLARKLQSRRTVGAKRRQQTSPDGTSVEQGTNIRAIPSVRSIGADMRAFEVSRDSRASAVRNTIARTQVAVCCSLLQHSILFIGSWTRFVAECALLFLFLLGVGTTACKPNCCKVQGSCSQWGRKSQWCCCDTCNDDIVSCIGLSS